MPYRSILVAMDIDAANEPLIRLAADLAARMSARLVGIAAANVPPPAVGPDGIAFDAGLKQQEWQAIESRLQILRKLFESVGGAIGDMEWRSAVDSPTRFAIDNARMADLIVADGVEGPHVANAYRSIDPGSLVLNAGRPVLLVQSGAERIGAHKVLIAWKDTRESRRAVTDALPLLTEATDVVVATVDADGDASSAAGLHDVTAYLARHGIRARAELVKEAGSRQAIARLALSMTADLVVSGAYGHSRIRELVFGGVTRTLLGASSFNRLLSN